MVGVDHSERRSGGDGLVSRPSDLDRALSICLPLKVGGQSCRLYVSPELLEAALKPAGVSVQSLRDMPPDSGAVALEFCLAPSLRAFESLAGEAVQIFSIEQSPPLILRASDNAMTASIEDVTIDVGDKPFAAVVAGPLTNPLVQALRNRARVAPRTSAMVAYGPIVIDQAALRGVGPGDELVISLAASPTGGLLTPTDAHPVGIAADHCVILSGFDDAAAATPTAGAVKAWLEFASAMIDEAAMRPGAAIPYAALSNNDAWLTLDAGRERIARGAIEFAEGQARFRAR